VTFLIRLLPEFSKFPLEPLLEHLRCPDQGLQGHFLVRPGLQREGGFEHGLEKPISDLRFAIAASGSGSASRWSVPTSTSVEAGNPLFLTNSSL